MRRKMPSGRNAFTLMEVVVALGLFAIMAVALLQSVVNVQEMLIQMDERKGDDDAKRFVMRRVMESATRDEVTAGGMVQLSDGSSVNWTATLVDTTVPDLHHLTLILEETGGKPETLELWAYRPGWSDSDTRSTLLQNLREEYPNSRFTTF